SPAAQVARISASLPRIVLVCDHGRPHTGHHQIDEALRHRRGLPPVRAQTNSKVDDYEEYRISIGGSKEPPVLRLRCRLGYESRAVCQERRFDPIACSETSQHLGHVPLDSADAEEECVGNLRSEEHTSELQSRFDLVCRLLLAKNNTGS